MAYTKYSLTPANNTAAPPDGAPEGMLPSAVNDTMRDMMAQIRDVGDGVRDGTYTMTAVKITGGTINGATIGATTATTGKFTTLTNSALTSGRITYAGASGLLSDTDGLTYDGTIFQVKLGNTATTQFRIAHSSAANYYADYNEKGDLTVGRNSWSSNVTADFSTTSATSSYTGDLAGGFSFKPRGSTAVTIAGNGNLLVGTTSQFAFATSRLAIGYSSSDFVTAMQNSNASPFGTYIKYSGAAPNGTSNEFIYCHDGTLRFSVMSNGGISNYSANNNNLSDEREKKNIKLAPNYLNKICQIPVKTFLYNDQTDTDLNLGVIAQDVETVCPELIMESNWGTKKEPKIRKSIYQTDLQYALMKCIQEQQALIESLTTRLTALENK